MFALIPFPVVLLFTAFLALDLFIFVAWLASRFIPEHQSGLVIKRFGRALPPGRLIALDGEAGYQARLLPPGWHWGLWRWRYKVLRVPLVHVPAGEIALVKSVDGAPMPPGRILAKDVPCDRFQDAEAFLRKGGERGRQIAFLTAGAYRINPSLFEVITAKNARAHELDPALLMVQRVPPEKVGIVTTL
ncbi:MAG TPA: flotillin family protein, partial [Thermoanaerobaculia bacterium]|nr:flotillin family protein [Thermoanaerobaculia bacterium]